MALLELANIDREITITPLTEASPGTPAYIQTISTKCAAPSGKGVLLDKITWTMASCTAPSHVFVSGGTLNDLIATSIKNLGESKKPLRKTDYGMCQGTFTGSGGLTCSCRFEITNAGQVKVKGE
jgi:hypothetical protein